MSENQQIKLQVWLEQIMHQIEDEELLEVAQEMAGQSFRAGLLLGLLPNEIDELEINARATGCSDWQINMQILQKWRERTTSAANEERLELAKVLKRLGKGRLAAKMEPSVREWEPQSALDPSQDTLSVLELEEVSREGRISETWIRLAVYLDVDEGRVRTIRGRDEEPSMQAFRCLWAWREAGRNFNKATLADALVKVSLGRLASKLYPSGKR